MSQLSIPVDASPTDPAWALLAKANASSTFIKGAIDLAGLQSKDAPRTPAAYLSLLQAYRAHGGFPVAFTETEQRELDELIKALETASPCSRNHSTDQPCPFRGQGTTDANA